MAKSPGAYKEYVNEVKGILDVSTDTPNSRVVEAAIKATLKGDVGRAESLIKRKQEIDAKNPHAYTLNPNLAKEVIPITEDYLKERKAKRFDFIGGFPKKEEDGGHDEEEYTGSEEYDAYIADKDKDKEKIDFQNGYKIIDNLFDDKNQISNAIINAPPMPDTTPQPNQTPTPDTTKNAAPASANKDAIAELIKLTPDDTRTRNEIYALADQYEKNSRNTYKRKLMSKKMKKN